MKHRTDYDDTRLICYTREPLEADVYSSKLAYSMHLALIENGMQLQVLNDHSGILFAKATEHSDGSLCAKSLKNPYMFQLHDGRFGIIAQRVEADGTLDSSSQGSILLFVTDDFIQYEEVGLLSLSGDAYVTDAICTYDHEKAMYVVDWRCNENKYYRSLFVNLISLEPAIEKSAGEPFEIVNTAQQWKMDGAVMRNSMTIPHSITQKMKKKLMRIAHIATEVSDTITASSLEDLTKHRALLTYSDGSTAQKMVQWDTSHINWDKSGAYQIQGKVKRKHYHFPIAINRADPNIFLWHGSYYFIATDDTTQGNLCFYVRKAEKVEDLEHAEEHLILDNTMYEELKVFLWAPEFHQIGEDLYLLFASSQGEFIQIRSLMMKLKTGGNPLKAEDWEEPVVVLKQDDTPLFDKGITLDMTYFAVDNKHYVIWAQRQFIPVDTGSFLYIASIQAEKPWQLTSEPVLITKPDYGWENNQTFVDEGAYAIVQEDKLYVTFSGALVNATYCVGLLSIDRDENLLDPSNWRKHNYPILTSRTFDGEFGPGHNSYVIDEEGNLLNVYHARPSLNGPRCSGIRQVHFGYDGEPILKLNGQQQLEDSLEHVTTKLIIP